MARERKHHDKIVRATASLIRRRGYAATGVNEIAQASGAPKGSLYHYFPGGKDAIVAEALRYAGKLVHATIEELARSHATPGAVALAYGERLAGWMAQSGFIDGCPITTTMLELHEDQPALATACRDAYRSWRDVFAALLMRAGVETGRAEHLALVAVMLLEGALILSRAERDTGPIIAAFDEIARSFEAAAPPRD